jgi:aspartokinase/homoserine dehydrogenase 1
LLSGTLSYIFNNLKVGTTFSSIVKEAMELGLTEPDPRVDLSLGDVQKKATILGRKMGLPLEYNDVEVIPFLPYSCFEADSIDDFFHQLKSEGDAIMESLRIEAAESNARVLPLAIIEQSKASIKLTKVTTASPFYNLSGSDNMIVFTTARYKDRPLVIQGPGAGAEVTSAGVFAEIIRIGNLFN